MNYEQVGNRLRDLLNLEVAPISITFLNTAPEAVPRLENPGPAGCTYWKLAAEGHVFYTVAEHHLNCTIGAHTHGVVLSPEKASELSSTIGTMVDLSYLRREEVAHIPCLPEFPGTAVYAPLSATPCEPDLVLIRAKAKQIMFVAEAAHAIGIGPNGTMMGRPACALIASTMKTRRAATSLGCIGNRVYTGLSDEEFYIALPGRQLTEVLSSLETIVEANQTLAQFHQARYASAQ